MAVTNARQDAVEPAVAQGSPSMDPPNAKVGGDDPPVRVVSGRKLKALGGQLQGKFKQYRQDRRIQEYRWLRNQRQYLGFYDPDIERELGKARSRAYPKITRVKVIQMVSRIMDLMFPSDEANWTLEARPSLDMDIADVQKAIADQQQLDQASGQQPPNPMTKEYVQRAVMKLSTKRAEEATVEINDQLQELGGDQSYDWPQLNNEIVLSGVQYGVGWLCGPYAREVKWASWDWDVTKNMPVAKKRVKYMPQFEFVSVWDLFPDLSAKRIQDMEGYFIRKVFSKRELLEKAKDDAFFGDIIRQYMKDNTGNYKPLEFETDLRTMGVKEAVNEVKADSSKYEVLIWKGQVDAKDLKSAGCDVPNDKMGDCIEGEIWTLDGFVIKADLSPWAELDTEMQTLHFFIFDKDDTAPIGFGLPNIMRDTQMSIAAATRMMLDNASVVCGPIVEMNTTLLRGDQDVSSIRAYKVFYRDDDGPSAQFPAIRPLTVESHIDELQKIIDLFMKLADTETFVNPMSGGDTTKVPGEPMRNLAGASMLMGAASLPFKQIIRNFDNLTRSVIQSIINFNTALNDGLLPVANYDVIARGALSLIAKEVRGMQIDNFVGTLKPQEEPYIDWQAIARARARVRDMGNVLVDDDEANRRLSVQSQADEMDRKLKQAGIEANTRNVLAQAFKNLAQGQANQARGNAEAVNAALTILENGAKLGANAQPPMVPQPAGGADQAAPALPGGPDNAEPPGIPPGLTAPPDYQGGGMPSAGLPN